MDSNADVVTRLGGEPVLLHVLSYLRPSELASVACCSPQLRPLALDESVWRSLTLRTFPAIEAGFEPKDGLWRAEFKERSEAAKRQVHPHV